MDHINAAREKIAKFNANRGKRAEQYKPKNGKNRVRFLPRCGDEDTFFKTYTAAFNVGPERKFIIPGDSPDCPYNQYLDKLRSSNRREDKERLKEMSPRAQIAAWCYDADFPTKIMVFYMTPNFASEVVGFMSDSEVGDFTDPQTGRAITFTYIAGKPARYERIQPERDPSPAVLHIPNVDLWRQYRIGEPSEREYIQAVLEGRAAAYWQERRDNASLAFEGNPVDVPFDVPAETAADAVQYCYPAGITPETQLHYSKDGAATQISAGAVAEALDRGEDLMIYHVSFGAWKPASSCGFAVIRPSAPPPPPAPFAPPPPPLPVVASGNVSSVADLEKLLASSSPQQESANSATIEELEKLLGA